MHTRNKPPQTQTQTQTQTYPQRDAGVGSLSTPWHSESERKSESESTKLTPGTREVAEEARIEKEREVPPRRFEEMI
jgi:hypothetical protein